MRLMFLSMMIVAAPMSGLAADNALYPSSPVGWKWRRATLGTPTAGSGATPANVQAEFRLSPLWPRLRNVLIEHGKKELADRMTDEALTILIVDGKGLTALQDAAIPPVKPADGSPIVTPPKETLPTKDPNADAGAPAEVPPKPMDKGGDTAAPAGKGEKPTEAKKDEAAKGEKPAEVKKDDAAKGEKPAEPKKDDAGKGEKPAETKKDEAAKGEKPAEPKKDDAGKGEKPAEPKKDDAAKGDKPVEPKKDDAGKGEKPAEPKKDEAAKDEKPAEPKQDAPAGNTN